MVNSREKGKRAEREIAALLRSEGYEVRRGQQYCGAEGNADVIGLWGIYAEVKRRLVKSLSDWLHKAMLEAVQEGKDSHPAVFHRGDNEAWMVTMYFDDWIQLYRSYEMDHSFKDWGGEGE